MIKVKIETSIGKSSRWPDGKPVKSELQPDGRMAHEMPDGRTIKVPPVPLYRIEYESRMAGDSYSVDVTFIGLCKEPGYVETWNHKLGQVRSYAFHKILGLTNIETGEVHPAKQLCKQLGGEMLS